MAQDVQHHDAILYIHEQVAIFLPVVLLKAFPLLTVGVCHAVIIESVDVVADVVVTIKAVVTDCITLPLLSIVAAVVPLVCWRFSTPIIEAMLSSYPILKPLKLLYDPWYKVAFPL